MVLFGLFGVGLIAWHWATECPAKPLVTFLADQARAIPVNGQLPHAKFRFTSMSALLVTATF
jgi:hypothetical protein